MIDSQLTFLPCTELGALVRSRAVSPRELVEAFLQRIEAVDPRIHAFISVCADEALAEASEREKELLTGQYRGPLHGIPIALKDNLATRTGRTTLGSRVFAHNEPGFDAAAVERLRAAGAVILGKTNLHELALGGTNINPHYGTVHNPWNHDCIAGGSSGGSAAAVAAGLCGAALGSDAAGSIRCPASFCGTVGLKPTYGLVSKVGHQGAVWSVDHLGPLTRTVADCALVLEAIAGHDPRDPTSARTTPPAYSRHLSDGIRGVRIGVPHAAFFPNIAAEVRAAFAAALEVLSDLGAIVTDVDLPSARVESTFSVHSVIIRSETSAFLDPFVRDRVGELDAVVRQRYLNGKLVPAVTYLNAQRARQLAIAEYDRVLQQVDLIATPTQVAPAPAIATARARKMDLDGGQIPWHPAIISFTYIYNLTGMPAISVPCGFSSSRLPIGLQLAARPFAEARLLRVAHAYEKAAAELSPCRHREWLP